MIFQDFSTVLEILFFGVPSLEVIIRTAIECASCSYHICEQLQLDKEIDKDKTGEEEKQTRAAPVPGPSPTVWVTTGNHRDYSHSVLTI